MVQPDQDEDILVLVALQANGMTFVVGSLLGKNLFQAARESLLDGIHDQGHVVQAQRLAKAKIQDDGGDLVGHPLSASSRG